MQSELADQRAAQLELLNEVARIATLDLELGPMLQRITDALASKFDWEFVALVTIDHERGAFRCQALTSRVESSVHVGYSRPLGSGIVGLVAATGEPELIDDVRTRDDYVDTLPGARSELCVPVKHHDRIVAVLNVESTREAAFHNQLPLLSTVADQIAGAIASAQAHAELQKRAQLMAMMSELSRTALEATELRDVLDRIERYIAAHFELRRVEIETCEDIPPSTSDAELIVPIRFQDSVVAALRLEGASPDVFSGSNRFAFHAFATQIAGAIRFAEMASQLEQQKRALQDANAHLAAAVEKLHHISTQDGVTGLANRRHFDQMLALEWRRAARTRVPLSLMMIDIDHFKDFNDRAGHQAGDDALRQVAKAVLTSVHRAADLAARYGGEEFVVLLPDTPCDQAHALAESIRQQVEELGAVTVSIGVASMLASRDEIAPEELIRVADAAMYDAKRSGRNRVISA